MTVLPSNRFARNYINWEVLIERAHNASCCMNIFFSVAMTKTFQHLKQCKPIPFLSVFSLESVTIAARCKFHKSLKTAVAFETPFSLANLINTPVLTGDVFQCNADRRCWMIQTHAGEVNLG